VKLISKLGRTFNISTSKKIKSEEGSSLIEVVVAVLMVTIIGAAVALALITSSKTLIYTDTNQKAMNFAEYEMENIKTQAYSDASYSINNTLAAYPGLTASYSITKITSGQEQEVTVTITGNKISPYTLTDYKVN
jgi:Tfp pilus assembly protein PilV